MTISYSATNPYIIFLLHIPHFKFLCYTQHFKKYQSDASFKCSGSPPPKGKAPIRVLFLLVIEVRGVERALRKQSSGLFLARRVDETYFPYVNPYGEMYALIRVLFSFGDRGVGSRKGTASPRPFCHFVTFPYEGNHIKKTVQWTVFSP